MDQSNAPDDFTYGGYSWDTLGTVNISDGSLIVTLGAGSSSSKYTIADAIRIEMTESVTPTLSLSITDASVSEGSRGCGHHCHGESDRYEWRPGGHPFER